MAYFRQFFSLKMVRELYKTCWTINCSMTFNSFKRELLTILCIFCDLLILSVFMKQNSDMASISKYRKRGENKGCFVGYKALVFLFCWNDSLAYKCFILLCCRCTVLGIQCYLFSLIADILALSPLPPAHFLNLLLELLYPCIKCGFHRSCVQGQFHIFLL